MASRLRDLIRAVRECKTAAEERAVIAKESAELRAAFKNSTGEHRHRNVAKLMYLHILGYPTHFGQMECLKLIAVNSFPEKRIGYLGLMVLLDERQEVLMLVTNSLKQDLHSKNQYTVGLALCALGNICSSEMARDLCPDVKKLMRSSTIYIKKKAALCAIRIVQKVPDLIEEFKDEALALLDERSHGVLLAAVTLAIEFCTASASVVAWYTPRAGNLVKMLKHLTTAGFSSSDHKVHGIPDPFLQVKVLHLLRILGRGNAEVSDLMGDVLAQVATNTDGSKNAGNAILYECVQTIMGTESIGGLRVLAVNILGRFLSNKDNNIRYVALNTLAKVVAVDAQAVQRHKSVIVECVRDADVSIRKRALELACALVNSSNIDAFMRELMDFLQSSEASFKKDLVEKVCHLTERFSPSPKWHIDTMTEVMESAGHYVTNHALRNLIITISTNSNIQGYAVRKLYRVMFDHLDHRSTPGLLLVCLWCVGEFGSQLLGSEGLQEGEEPLKVTEDEVVSMVEQVTRSQPGSKEVLEYALTALIKLSDRYPAQCERVKVIIAKYKDSSFLELQQRSCEFDRLFDHTKIRAQLLEPFPAFTIDNGEDSAGPGAEPASNGAPMISSPEPATAGGAADILGVDLMSTPAPMGGGDVLADLLGSAGVAEPAPAGPAPSGMQDLMGSGGGDIMDLLGGAAPAPVSAAPAFPSIVAYNKAGVVVEFAFEKPPGQPQVTAISATYKNSSPAVVTNFLLQAAVPKFMQVRLEPASGNQLPPGGTGTISQRLTLTNSMHGQKGLIMRLKVDFASNGAPVSDMVEVKNFPPGL